MHSVVNNNVRIPPGDKTYRLTQSYTAPHDIEVYGQFPHMHLLGKDVKAVATLPDGTSRQLLRITDWDFNWQIYYQFARPLRLPRGTRVDVEWTFDNSADNPRNPNQPPKLVTYGEQTTNEMAVLVLDVAPVGAAGGNTPAAAADVAPAQQVKRIEEGKAREVGKLLAEATAKLDKVPLRVSLDSERCMGLEVSGRGLLVVPDAHLTVEKLKGLDKEVLPLGILYTHKVTPVVAEDALPWDRHLTVEISAEKQTVRLPAMHLAATRVADRLVLLLYSKDAEPVMVTTLVESEKKQTLPIELEAGNQGANLVIRLFGRYRAAIPMGTLE